MTTCRNYIVDGNFDSWVNASVSIGASTATNMAATMFWASTNAGAAATIAQGKFGPGTQAPAMTTPCSNFLTYQMTSAGGGQIISRMESALTLAGQSATFSCWLWRGANPVTITGISWAQVFGTGGSPSANVMVTVPVNWVITTTPQRFSVRLDLSSVSGKTFGTNNNDFMQVAINLPTTGLFNLSTTQWQDEQCSPQAPAAGSPTPFEYRGQQAELARVQRYYEQVGITLGTSAANGYTNVASYKATKRATPALAQVNANPLNGGSFGAGIIGTDCVRQIAIATTLTDIILAADARL
jgi:hypothetical protein